jgi:hypothetical protein
VAWKASSLDHTDRRRSTTAATPASARSRRFAATPDSRAWVMSRRELVGHRRGMTLWSQNVRVRSNRGDQFGDADIEIQSSRSVLLVELYGCLIDDTQRRLGDGTASRRCRCACGGTRLVRKDAQHDCTLVMRAMRGEGGELGACSVVRFDPRPAHALNAADIRIGNPIGNPLRTRLSWALPNTLCVCG